MLKLKAKTGNMKVIVPWDPAIDTTKSDMASYLSDLDINKLVFHAGKEPSVVHLNEHPKWIAAKLVGPSAVGGMMSVVHTFMYSINKIENLQDHLLSADAETTGPGHYTPSETVAGPNGVTLPAISEEDAIAYFDFEFMGFITQVTSVRSFLRKGTVNPYRQRLSSYLATAEKKA